jgi:phospholipid-transporting ATPase
MIKEVNKSITMAIGDGANDVGMITEANVGIGIQGIEGTQAARASDYVISQFSHIKKLLFFHGREYYRRNTWVIGYNFYKNFLYISPVFWAGIITCFSGVTIFDPWILQLYNPLFVALPCGWYGIYSLEYPQKVLLNHPELYIQGMEGKCFSMLDFLKFIGFAFMEGFLIYFFGNFWFHKGNSDGNVDDFYAVGTSVYAAVIFAANLRIVLQTHIHEFYSTMITSLSAFSYFLFVFIMSNNYILPGSIVKEFLILDNWKAVILDMKFYLYIIAISVIIYFIEICSDKYPGLFFGDSIIKVDYRKEKENNYIDLKDNKIKENKNGNTEKNFEQIQNDNDISEILLNENKKIDVIKEEENIEK